MIRDLEINMAAPLAPGESWEVKYRELGTTTDTTLLPFPTSNPFIIPALDDTKCYQVTVRKKCVTGYFGAPVNGLYGNCVETPISLQWVYSPHFAGQFDISVNGDMVINSADTDFAGGSGTLLLQPGDSVTVTMTSVADECSRLTVARGVGTDPLVILYNGEGTGYYSYTFTALAGGYYDVYAETLVC